LDLDPDNKSIAEEEKEAERKAKAADLEKEGDALMLAGKFAEASQVYGTAQGLDPTCERLPTKKADAEKKARAQELKEQAEHECDANDFAKAVGTFDEALALDPDDGSERHAEIQRERDEAARKAKALELKKRGEDEMANGDYEQAVKTFLEAMQLDPSNKIVAEEEAEAERKARSAQLKKEGDELMAKGDYAAAAAKYKAAKELLPKSKKLKKLYEEALAAQEKAERLAKAQQLKELAEHECDAEDYAKAVDTFNEALTYDPDNAEIVRERDEAAAKAKAKAEQDAAVAAEAAKQKKIKDLKKQGERAMDDGDYPEALRCFKLAHALSPKSKKLKKLLDECNELMADAHNKSDAANLEELGDHEMDMRYVRTPSATVVDHRPRNSLTPLMCMVLSDTMPTPSRRMTAPWRSIQTTSHFVRSATLRRRKRRRRS
jgi:tetratricopeptide (TPR) repeat protein